MTPNTNTPRRVHPAVVCAALRSRKFKQHRSHGELENVTIPGEGSISVNQFKWTAPAKLTLPGGTVQDRTLDGLLNLEALKVNTPGAQTTLSVSNTYGKVQELKTNTRTDSAPQGSSTKTSTFSYDDETRLTQAVTDTGGLFGTATETFTLDGVANRIAHSQVSGAWSYDANNRLIQRGVGANSTSYQYDDAGNLTQKTDTAGGASQITQYRYDTQNRLVQVQDGQARLIARYGYDPQNRRIWKEQYRDPSTGSGQARRTYYLYADEGLIAEATQDITLGAGDVVTASNANAPAITTQYGPTPYSEFSTNVLFIKTKNNNGQPSFAYYHRDHLGTPMQATDKAGNIVWSASYNVFGLASITTPNPTTSNGVPNYGTIESNLRLPGQYEDVETGLYYNFNRYYDPVTGRYVTSDPIGPAGGLNFYAYAGAAPAVLADPMGLEPMDWLWGAIYWATGGRGPSQGVVDAVVGFGDAFLIPELIRNALDIDGGINQCSAAYRGGKVAGFVWGAIPFALSGAAALGATRVGKLLDMNSNRYLRIGPGSAKNGARFGLGRGKNGEKVPMLRIGKGKPSDLNHIDLRSRLPKIAPLGGPIECGCP